MSGLKAALTMSAALVAIGACASVGEILPDQSTLTSVKQPLLVSSPATNYTASSSQGKGLATAENRGATDEFTLSMPKVEGELNGLLKQLSVKWPHPTPAPAQVKVALGNEYQAVTFPDGVIVIDLGALDALQGPAIEDLSVSAGYVQTDQELLYMLGHEFSHYALGHHNKTDSMQQVRGITNTLVGVHNASATLSRARYQQNAGGGGQVVVQDQRGLNTDVNKAIGLFERVDTISRSGVSPAWNRGQEDDADALSLDLMKAAGVKGQFYQDVFGKLKKQETISNQLMSSLKASVGQTQRQMLSPASLNAMTNGRAQQTTEALAIDFGKTLANSASESVFNYMTATHRSPEVRLKGLLAYETNAYPGADPFDVTDPTTAVLTRIRALPEFKDAKVATIAYYEAIDAHAKGNMPAAEAAIGRALATSLKNQPALLYRAGRIAESAGKRDRAIGYYQQALAQPSANPETYRQLAAAQIDKGDNRGALATIAKGEKDLGDADYFLPTRILMATRQKQNAEVVTLTLKCRQTNRQDLVTLCEAHRLGLNPETLTPEQRAQLEQQQRKGGTDILGAITSLIPGQK